MLSRPIPHLSALNICPGLLLVIGMLAAPQGVAQQSVAVAQPSVAEIVQQMVSRNKNRAQLLGPFTSLRDYHLKYLGFPHSAEADMVVDVSRESETSIQFHVVSESGSHFLADHVLIRLLKAEQNADRDRSSSGLTPANYDFTLVGTETSNGRKTYVLRVEPKRAKRFLYRGTIWVDAGDYAVVKIDAEPARSLSFWIRNTQIHHEYEKIGAFWLPEEDRSRTRVLLGGSALLSIDYEHYRFASSSLPPSSGADHAWNAAMDAPR
jgi:hypothetical protein